MYLRWHRDHCVITTYKQMHCKPMVRTSLTCYTIKFFGSLYKSAAVELFPESFVCSDDGTADQRFHISEYLTLHTETKICIKIIACNLSMKRSIPQVLCEDIIMLYIEPSLRWSWTVLAIVADCDDGWPAFLCKLLCGYILSQSVTVLSVLLDKLNPPTKSDLEGTDWLSQES